MGLYSTLEEYLARDIDRAMNWFRTWFLMEPLTFEIIIVIIILGLHYDYKSKNKCKEMLILSSNV